MGGKPTVSNNSRHNLLEIDDNIGGESKKLVLQNCWTNEIHNEVGTWGSWVKGFKNSDKSWKNGVFCVHIHCAEIIEKWERE